MNKKLFFTFLLVAGVSVFLILRTNSTHEKKNQLVMNKSSQESIEKRLPSTKKNTEKSRKIASIDSHSLNNINMRKKKRARYVSSFTKFQKKVVRGAKLRAGDTNGDIYKVNNFLALKKDDYRESYGKKIKFLNNYIVFEPTNEFKESSTFKKTTGVVQFSNSGDIGVLTGKINLQIGKDIVVNDDFFKKYKVEVHSSVKAINFFYVSPDSDDDIYQVAQNLIADENVIKAYVEILSNPVIPN